MHLSVESSWWRAGLLLRLGMLLNTRVGSKVILSSCPQPQSLLIFSSCCLVESGSHPSRLDPAGGFLVLLSCGLALFTYQWVQWWIFVVARFVCEGPGSSGADDSPSDLHTNPPWTQPAPRISTKWTECISISLSQCASRISGFLCKKHSIGHCVTLGGKDPSIWEMFGFWLSLEVD